MREIREHLKNLTAENLSDAIDKLLSLVQYRVGNQSRKDKLRQIDDIILLKGQYLSALQEYNTGLITRPERELVFQRVSKSLLHVIGTLPNSFFELSDEDKKLFYAGELLKIENEAIADHLFKVAQKEGKNSIRLAWGGIAVCLVILVLVFGYRWVKKESLDSSSQSSELIETETKSKEVEEIRINGEVVCMDSDEPLIGIKVQIDTFKPLLTDEEGKYSGLFPLKNGDRYLLTLTKGKKLLFKDRVMATDNNTIIPIQGNNCNL